MRENIVTISYLSYLYDGFLSSCCIHIKQIYGENSFNVYKDEILDISNLDFQRYGTWNQLVSHDLEKMWNSLRSKDYLKLQLSNDSILLLDTLWGIGNQYDRFTPPPIFLIGIIGKDNWETQKNSDYSAVNMIHSHYSNILRITYATKLLLTELEKQTI
jgi:hypothetical protein